MNRRALQPETAQCSKLYLKKSGLNRLPPPNF
jgi:hypothetical protein